MQRPKSPAAKPSRAASWSAYAATEATGGQAVAADPAQRADVVGDQDHGELAIATAAIGAQVIAAAGAEATGRQRREELR